jgi:hypothetical protein
MKATRRLAALLLLLAGPTSLFAQENLGSVRQQDRLRLFLPPGIAESFPLPDVGYHGQVSAVVMRPGTDTLLLSTRSGTTWKLSSEASGFQVAPMLDEGSYTVAFQRLEVARGTRRIGVVVGRQTVDVWRPVKPS